jgi:ankyrin repeat protein
MITESTVIFSQLSPTWYNCYCRYEEIVELLVKAGADVNVQNQDTGSTALHHAAVLRSVRAMQCLLDGGTVLEEGGSEGRMTVLHEAAKAGSVAVVELLLRQGADYLVNARDKVCGLYEE